MGAGKRIVKFGSGGLLGAAVGTAVAILWAPQSGDELKGRLADRLRQARLAGAEAKAAKEDELIRKYRSEVDDPAALRDEEAKVRVEAAEAVAAVGTWHLLIVKRSDRAKGFVVLPKRWVVERTLAWLSRCRRLVRNHELYHRTVTAFIRLAMIRLMLRRLGAQ